MTEILDTAHRVDMHGDKLLISGAVMHIKLCSIADTVTNGLRFSSSFKFKSRWKGSMPQKEDSPG